MPIKKKVGERKNDFINRCIGVEVSSGMKPNKAAAVCYTYWEELSLKELKTRRKLELGIEGKILKHLKGKGEDFTKLGITLEDIKNPNFQNKISEDEHLLTFTEVPAGYVVRYKYEGPEDNKNRPFCRTMMKNFQTTWWSREDIESLNTAPGKADRKGGKPYSVFNWRGGNYCRHQWVRYYYNPTSGDILRTPVQPAQKSTDPK